MSYTKFLGMGKGQQRGHASPSTVGEKLRDLLLQGRDERRSLDAQQVCHLRIFTEIIDLSK